MRKRKKYLKNIFFQNNLKNVAPLPFAIADFLGFKELITSAKDINVVTQNYLAFCRDVYSAAGFAKPPAPDFSFISDSIFIFNNKDNILDVNLQVQGMVKYLSNLIHNSVISLNFEPPKKMPVPIRAALSYGEYLAEKDVKLFNNEKIFAPVILGKAIVDAHIWEESQKWLGASIDPESNKIMIKEMNDTMEELKRKKLLVPYDVPTIDGLIHTNAINFNYINHFKHLFNNLEEKENFYQDNKKISAKYQEAKQFLTYCNNNGFIIER